MRVMFCSSDPAVVCSEDPEMSRDSHVTVIIYEEWKSHDSHEVMMM